MVSKKRSEWWVPVGLIVLSLVPVGAGMARLGQLAGGVVTPENARFVASPTAVVLHIISITIFSLLGALQFAPRLRRTRPRWHRVAGRVVVPAGLIAAASGLWLSQFNAAPATDSAALHVIRLMVGTAMMLSLTQGTLAIVRRDVARHQDWMLRGYALGMGAGTQVFTNLPWVVLVGPPDRFTFAVLMGAGWGINVLVAEWLIWRRTASQRAAVALRPGALPIPP